jgi:predicted regulator of Ras-like GTPase activity (Roadblock/LC7/MglB family)
MAIEGNLREMSLPTLVQYACTDGQRACLTVRRGSESAYLYFLEGNLVHAVLDDEIGEEVLYRILKWEDGTFRLAPSAEIPQPSIATPWSVLLVNGLQRADEETWDEDEVHAEESEMPENIRDILRELAGRVPGFMTAAIVGMDGLGIADYSVGDVDAESISGQLTLLLKLVDTTVTKLTNDEVEDYLLTTENAYLLAWHLENKHYFLGLIADRSTGRLGNMFLNGRLYASRLYKALPH